MNAKDIQAVYQAQASPEDCEREIADYEAHCDLVCSLIGPACNECDVPVIISVLKKRRNDLIKKGV